MMQMHLDDRVFKISPPFYKTTANSRPHWHNFDNY